MHVVDGVLSAPVLVTGALAATVGVAYGLRAVTSEALPRVGLVGAALFVASLIHVPIGPASVHLVLGGLAGLVLGWAAFPAVFVSLLLQAAFFGHGGVTALGINTLAIALPAVLCHYALRGQWHRAPFAAGIAAGSLAAAAAAVIVAAALAASGEAFVLAAKLVLISHLPVLAAEALLTGAAVSVLAQVKPDALSAPDPSPPAGAFGHG